MDDMREITQMNITASDDLSTTVLDFYTMATSNLVVSLAKVIRDSQSKNNWKMAMTYFHMIQVLLRVVICQLKNIYIYIYIYTG